MSEELNKYHISDRRILGTEYYIYAKSEDDANKIFDWVKHNIYLEHCDYSVCEVKRDTIPAGSFDEKEIFSEHRSDGYHIVTKYENDGNLAMDDSELESLKCQLWYRRFHR